MAVALIGLPGCGKSTLGKLLARRLGTTFVDVDAAVEKRRRLTVAQIFAADGEAVFRQMEQDEFARIAESPEGVVATGGGLVLRAQSRALLIERYTVIYLRAMVPCLFERTRNNARRPLLQVADRRAKLEELFEQRDPLYRETAHLTVDVIEARPDAALERMLVLLGRPPMNP